MSNIIKACKRKVLAGESLTRGEALALLRTPEPNTLFEAADELRAHFCGNRFDLCTIVNGKSGRCTEDCRYCAQSCHYPAGVESYPLLDGDRLLEGAAYNARKGVLRYSVVTSGRRLSDGETAALCESYRRMRDAGGIALCASHGLLSFEQLCALKAAGVTRYHNNLETSRRFFPSVCTTHTYDDKLRTIRDAQRAGLTVCSGGILGLGETEEDRVDLALELRELGIRSIPLNVLNPIPGTPPRRASPPFQGGGVPGRRRFPLSPAEGGNPSCGRARPAPRPGTAGVPRGGERRHHRGYAHHCRGWDR